MTFEQQPPSSLKKRSLSEVSHELVTRPQKMTRSAAQDTQAKSTLSASSHTPPHTLPHTPPPTDRKRASSSKSFTSSNGTSTPRASKARDATPVTPQSISTYNTCESPPSEDEPEESSPPIILSRFKWASQSSVKIPKRGLHTPTCRQSETSTGANWAGVLGQVSKMYRYNRLPENRVRLLLIKPGTFDEQVNASLMTVHDDELGSDKYPYAALSYNWGNGEYSDTIIIQDDPSSQPVKSIKSIVDALNAAAHGKMLKVKPNLYEALKHLRKENEVVGLWVDALCINQFDIKEKEEQVLKMPQIYQKAYNVNIWLGSDDVGNLVSDRAMAFIPKVIDPDNHSALLLDDSHIESWASLYDLLKWSWFSRRWIIQELAFAQSASVHCGKHVRDWGDFQTAIAIFHRHFDSLKGKLMVHYESSQAKRSQLDDDSTLEIEHLGAKLLVDMTSTLFRKRRDGSLESTKSLESLVCSLSGFDTSDPRDAITALRSISKEVIRQDSSMASTQKPPPAPNYGNDLFEVYRDFVEWVVAETASIDIICRHWALKERNQPMPTTPRLVRLPSWILFVEDSAWGKGEELFRGRKAGDSFVGLPGSNKYNACGRKRMHAEVNFPRSPVERSNDTTAQVIHDMSLYVKGAIVGLVSFRTDPFPDGVITRDCLQGLGWYLDKDATEITEVPSQLWQTLVADRDPHGLPPPHWYKRACQHCLTYQTNNGHINIGNILRRNLQTGQQSIVHEYLRRVRAVTWNRSFLEGDPLCNTASKKFDAPSEKLVGFGPPKTEKGDVIAILYGCSVPVILRPCLDAPGDPTQYLFIGEAYIYGNMDGEAFDHHYEERTFKLI